MCLAACTHVDNPSSALQDLSQWNAVGEAQWLTQNGVTSSSSRAEISYLVSPAPFTDYTLEVEFFPTPEVNSGVFVACQSPTEIDPINCHEVNIWDRHPKQEFRTGAIVTKAFPPVVHIDTLNKWNKYLIVVAQGSVTVTLNGQITAKLERSELNSGYIALQKAEGGEIKFRNVRLTLP